MPRRKATPGRITPSRVYGRLTISLVSIGLMIGALLYTAPVIRDAVFAIYAHRMVGEAVPFSPDYTRGLTLDPAYAWGVQTNSVWLLDKVFLIVPFFASEGLSGQPWYPDRAFFVPLQGQRSFVVAGSARCDPGEKTLVVLNERVVFDPRWNDEADALHTLVHELIHVQGGNFCSGSSEQLESMTAAATIEILASMCNWGDDLACKAFWGGIEAFARRSLWVQAHRVKLDWLFNVWSDVFLRSSAESRAARKTDRFWEGSIGERYTIGLKYGYIPWRDIFLVGVCNPRQGMVTGKITLNERGQQVFLIMPFDDTLDLLGWLGPLTCIR